MCDRGTAEALGYFAQRLNGASENDWSAQGWEAPEAGLEPPIGAPSEFLVRE